MHSFARITHNTLIGARDRRVGGTKRDRGGPTPAGEKQAGRNGTGRGPTPADGDLQKSHQRRLVLKIRKTLPESGRGFPLLEPTP